MLYQNQSKPTKEKTQETGNRRAVKEMPRMLKGDPKRTGKHRDRKQPVHAASGHKALKLLQKDEFDRIPNRK